MYFSAGYVVHNNMWNAGGYNVSQTTSVCDYNSWYATTIANDNGDGAVKTYPNVHVDYHDWSTGAEPALSSFSRIESTFAHESPGAVGIYNFAYDIWLNGVPGNREVMIWTENHRQTPAGVKRSTMTLSGRSWDLYATGTNSILSFVPTNGPLTQGTLDLTAFLDYLNVNGYLPANSTLGQVDYGVEVVSTDGRPTRFGFTEFSIATVR